MSYERQNSTRLEQYRARQAERIDAMNRAIEAGQTTVVASSSENAEPVRTPINIDFKPGNSDFSRTVLTTVKPFIEGYRRAGLIPTRGRKSPTAAGVEVAIRPRIDVRAAALISSTSQDEPRDGQLFAYDARTGRMVPVNERDVAQRVRVVTRGRGRPRRHNLAVARNK
ncbi:hypothetical protein [Citrobacter amalonaticus]|uniref:hypothetical protein n=1 Tax=Citrobacter amalonaticus TaxID=35703 RepID=UPI00136D36FF|nr:hypothetical protein [Citrobacter amalonaticus]MZK91458.1 hypothetical protein [Citrobacter amalonaticus]MZL05718.1 hypothetical protein [Citrobacter amalonaticus]MZL25783.1 hypothetical protein [Citrobacter amalonaticus]HED1792747.1 hypothetical protein [Citrobacter amalonaticus]